jgi:putative hemolysin
MITLMTAICETSNRPPLARHGALSVKLASTDQEIAACQKLRFKVFYEELGAKSGAAERSQGLDADGFDAVCDHLMVVDGEKAVGTYRLLRQCNADPKLGFYTQAEFDIAPLITLHDNHRFLELGRSCVLRPWRTKPVVELLWQGIWNYVRLHRLDVMFGCASLEGTDLQALSQQLSFLHHKFLAQDNWVVLAVKDRYVEMNRAPVDAIDQRTVFKSLPPLIKGYLRLGARVGHGAVTDHQFNTTDVLIILPVKHINPRYFNRFGAPDTSR